MNLLGFYSCWNGEENYMTQSLYIFCQQKEGLYMPLFLFSIEFYKISFDQKKNRILQDYALIL